jgi:hypothetical protein
MTGTVLLWGLPEDPPLGAVRNALEQIGSHATMLDQRAVLDTEVELTVCSGVTGCLRFAGETIDLSSVTALYLRPDDWREFPALATAGPTSDSWQHALNVHDMLMSWAELTSALVVNRPAAMASNCSKPYQSAWIQSLGFRIPDTLVTTDPAQALEFWRRHESVIYKSVSGIRSIVSRLTPEHVSRLPDIASCPTQFQQYVSGTDYRVHVVGGQLFACQIISAADDYRYSAEPVYMEPCDLPPDLTASCGKLAASMSLMLAGIDLRRTPEDEWFCFEVNSSPGFTYFQDKTGQPIAEAIARLLDSGAPVQHACGSAGSYNTYKFQGR